MMALFGASSVSAKAQAPTGEMEEMRAELQKMKEFARIRAKYGQNLTDDQVSALVEKERLTSANIKRREEDRKQAILEEAKRDKEIRALACTMVTDGTLRISSNGERVSKITTDLTLPCPYCGHPRVRPTDGILEIAKAWYNTPTDQRFSAYSPFLIRNARNPLSDFIGILAWHSGYPCPSCKKVVIDLIQIVLV